MRPQKFPTRWVGVAFQAPPGSQASSRGEAKDSALLSSRDAGLLEPPERPQPLEGTQRVGNFCGRIKGVKYRFALKDRTWDFPGDAGNFGVPLK